MPVEKHPAGLVCTFYSYKGGVGRLMALANVAALLARWGQRVLVIDWDLEAPGLERFFGARVYGSRRDVPGLVDLIIAFRGGEPLNWSSCVLKAAIPQGGSIDIIHAGRDDKTYLDRLSTIHWDELFKQGLGDYLEGLRIEWKRKYDYVLVDSRTGITDVGGICSILLPDYLVSMFTTSEQSVLGVKDAMTRARAVQGDLPLDRQRLVIIPIAARDESSREYERAALWRKRFAQELAGFYEDWIHKDETPESVLDYLKIPYVAFWSFGEQLPVLEEDASNPKTLAYSYALVARLLHGRLDWSEVREGRQATEAETEHATQVQSRLAEASKIRVEALAQQNEEASQLFKERERRLMDRYDRLNLILKVRSRKHSSLIVLLAVVAVGAGVYWLTQQNYPLVIVTLGYVDACAIAWCVIRLRHNNAKLDQLEREQAAYSIRHGNYADLSSESALRLFGDRIENITAGSAKATVQSAASDLTDSADTAQPSAPPPALPPERPSVPTLTGSPQRAAKGAAIPDERIPIDVFLSYPATGITRDWVIEFAPLFTKWLAEMLGRNVMVFDPYQSIPPGSDRPQVLSERIAMSRAVVLILTRRTLQSDWARQELRAVVDAIPSERLFPITLDRLPPSDLSSDLARVRWTDFADLAYVGEGFTKSERYIEFQDRIRALAETVANSIEQDATSDLPLASRSA